MKDKDIKTMAWLLLAMFQIEQNEGESNLVKALKKLADRETKERITE